MVISKQYLPSGWLVDGVHKDAGEVINMTPDIVLEPDYIRTVSPATFPANPTRTNFVFKGWVDNENYNSTDDYNYYTTYDGGEDLTLYAKWEIDEQQQAQDAANLVDVYIYNLTTKKAVVNVTTVTYVKNMYNNLTEYGKSLVKNYSTLQEYIRNNQ